MLLTLSISIGLRVWAPARWTHKQVAWDRRTRTAPPLTFPAPPLPASPPSQRAAQATSPGTWKAPAVGVYGSGFRVYSAGSRVKSLGFTSGFMVYGLGFRVSGLGRATGLGLRAGNESWGLGFRV